MNPDQFRSQMAELTQGLAGRPLDADLQAWLNREHGVGSPVYAALKAACEAGVADGWLCQREGGGIRYGRIFKPAPDLHDFSVDVVDMQDIAGPHHVHPTGWLVMPPGSAHRPTVSRGRALVLYLLPQGAIEFTS